MREFIVLHTDDADPKLHMKIVYADDMIAALQVSGVPPRLLWACSDMENAKYMSKAMDVMLAQPAYIQMKRQEQRG